MQELNMDALISKLKADNVNVLILDTCCLLDIIRVPDRENLDVIESAYQLLEKKSLNKLNVVLPSLIRDEWNENVSNVCDYSSNIIKKNQKKIKVFKEIAEKLHIRTLQLQDFSLFGIEIKLKDLSSKVIDISLVLGEDIAYRTKAIERVVKVIPPSAKGKDSTKDCIIYEEALAIGEKLRLEGFTGKIVFASSNTNEYNKEFIADELNSRGMIYAMNLNFGVHEV
jgi:hypothetical protein